jgi:hypothetical protein
LDGHAGEAGRDPGKRAVPIVHQITRRLVLGERVPQLLGGPRRGWLVTGDVHDPPPMMRKDDEHEEQPERDRWHNEEVSRHDLAGVIREERAPRLRRGGPVSSHVLGDGGLAQRDARLLQLAVNPRCTPERIRQWRSALEERERQARARPATPDQSAASSSFALGGHGRVHEPDFNAQTR